MYGGQPLLGQFGFIGLLLTASTIAYCKINRGTTTAKLTGNIQLSSGQYISVALFCSLNPYPYSYDCTMISNGDVMVRCVSMSIASVYKVNLC